MKLKFIISLSLLLFVATLYAQPNRVRKQGREDRLKALQIAYITEKLELTPTESEKFWPIFNQMEYEKGSLIGEKNNEVYPTTDKEAQANINKHFEIREKEIAIEKKYTDQLKQAIPLTKIAKLLMVQKQFRQEVLSKLVNKKKGISE